MKRRYFVGIGLLFVLASSPVTLARYSGSADPQKAAATPASFETVYDQTATRHMMSLISVLAKPQPHLVAGALVKSAEGQTIGRIEDVIVHQSDIKAIVSLAPSGEAVVLPATAFDSDKGEVTLAAPVDTFGPLEVLSP